jgi:hypothetical protein
MSNYVARSHKRFDSFQTYGKSCRQHVCLDELSLSTGYQLQETDPTSRTKSVSIIISFAFQQESTTPILRYLRAYDFQKIPFLKYFLCKHCCRMCTINNDERNICKSNASQHLTTYVQHVCHVGGHAANRSLTNQSGRTRFPAGESLVKIFS